MEKLEYFASFWDFTNEPAARLARRLTDLSGLAGVYFTAGGSESNEIAIMMARLFHARRGAPERTVILARRKAYHGITYARARGYRPRRLPHRCRPASGRLRPPDSPRALPHGLLHRHLRRGARGDDRGDRRRPDRRNDRGARDGDGRHGRTAR